MTDLRERILRALKGSTSSNPTPHSALRKICDGVDELQQLKEELDALRREHVICCAQSIQEGQPQFRYWIYGTKGHVPPRPIPQPAPAPAWSQPAAAKVQPNTSIPPKPQPEKQPMSTNAPSELRTALFDKITAQPGIAQDALLKHALQKCPGSTEKQAKQTLSNMKYSKHIHTQGERANPAYFTGAPAAQAPKPAAPEKKAKPKAPRAKAPKNPAHAKQPDDDLFIALQEDGHLAIARGQGQIVLSPEHIKRVQSFIARVRI